MNLCLRLRLCLRLCLCLCLYLCLCLSVCVYVCVCLCVCARVCVCIRVSLCAYICVYAGGLSYLHSTPEVWNGMMRWDREDTELVQRERLQGASAAEREVTEEDREGRHAVHPCHPFFSVLRDHAAGLIVAGTIGIASEHLAASAAVALSPLLYATAIGIAVGNVIRIFDPQMNIYSPLASGLAFAKRRLLRAGIILYGAKLTFAKILDIGWAGLFIDLYVVSTTLFFGFALGRMLGLTEPLTGE